MSEALTDQLRRPGRPKKAVKSRPVQFRFTPREKAAFKRAADVAGMTMSEWVRQRLRNAATHELEKHGEVAAFLDVKDDVAET